MSRRPPSLDGLPLIGNLLEARRDPLRFVLKMAAVPSNLVHYRIGPYTGYLVNHPDDIQYVLRRNFQNYSKENYDYKVLKPVLGEGLLTASGEHWRHQRRVIQPAFHRRRMEAFGSKATTATLEMLARWQTDSAQEQPIDIAAEMSRLTLRIIGDVLFSTELHGEDQRVARSFQFLNTDVSARLKTAFAPPLWVPTPRNIQFKRARAELDRVVYAIIEGRRHRDPAKGDLLDLLLAARGQEASSTGMTTRQLRDEVMTFMLAGHETTATALTWFWYLLAKHPEKAHQSWHELEEVLGGRTPKVSDLPVLGYLDMLVHEVLRLYPPVWIISRKALAEDEIGGYPVPPGQGLLKVAIYIGVSLRNRRSLPVEAISLPKCGIASAKITAQWPSPPTLRKPCPPGTVVLLCQYAMHRHPAFWENPERFDPDRFSPQRSQRRHPFAYFPFGGGPRLCTGNHLAMMEIKLIAATISQRYRLVLAAVHPVEVEPLITLRPRHGLKMRLHPRRH